MKRVFTDQSAIYINIAVSEIYFRRFDEFEQRFRILKTVEPARLYITKRFPDVCPVDIPRIKVCVALALGYLPGHGALSAPRLAYYVHNILRPEHRGKVRKDCTSLFFVGRSYSTSYYFRPSILRAETAAVREPIYNNFIVYISPLQCAPYVVIRIFVLRHRFKEAVGECVFQ